MLKGFLFFLRYGWKYDPRYVLWRLLYQITHSLIPLAGALMPKYVIEELIGEKRLDRLILYVFLFAGYMLIADALSSFFSLDGFTRRCRVDAEFHNMLHAHLSLADYSCLESPEFKDMQAKAEKFLTCDFHGFGYLLDCAMNMIGQTLTLMGLCALLSMLNPWILLLFFLIVLLSVHIEAQAKRKAMALSLKVVQDQRKWSYYSRLFDNARFGKEIRLYGIRDWLLKRERKCFTACNDNTKRQNDAYIHSGVLRSLLTFFQQCAAYLYTIRQVLAGQIGVGDFVLAVNAASSFATALRQIMDSVTEIRAYDLYYDQLDRYLSLPRKQRQGTIAPPASDSLEIRFQEVGFRYPGAETWALRHVNLTVRSGERLGIIGENGSGKTTLIKLLCGLYAPTEGKILLNGQNIAQFDYDQYARLFSPVFQDLQLFEFSLRENITLSSDATDETLWIILKKVGLEKRVQSLPRKLDTTVGREFDPQGFLPSGGEAQKIVMARALFKNAPITLLDEPTAALDPRAEYELYQQWDALFKEKTILYISHRLSFSNRCDHVAVFDQGRLTEYGTPDALLRQHGKYAELYRMQADAYKGQRQ